MPKTAAAATETTITMKQRAPKKNSVLFENNEPNTPLQTAYVMREGMKAIGITDLDSVKEIEVTIRAK